MNAAERNKELTLIRNQNAHDADWWAKHSSHGPTDYVRQITFLLSEIDRRAEALRKIRDMKFREDDWDEPGMVAVEIAREAQGED